MQYEEAYVLKKIEQWLDKLPYRSAEIRIEMRDKTYTLEKQKKPPMGFFGGSQSNIVD